jgi:hypothetical protein
MDKDASAIITARIVLFPVIRNDVLLAFKKMDCMIFIMLIRNASLPQGPADYHKALHTIGFPLLRE